MSETPLNPLPGVAGEQVFSTAVGLMARSLLEVTTGTSLSAASI